MCAIRWARSSSTTKGGAGGNIGADAIAKASPDGLTIGIAATATHAVNPWLYSRMPFDAAKDFVAITQMVRVPMCWS